MRHSEERSYVSVSRQFEPAEVRYLAQVPYLQPQLHISAIEEDLQDFLPVQTKSK